MPDRPRGPAVYDLDWRSVAVVLAAFVGLVALTGLLRAAPKSLTWITIGTLLALALNPVIGTLSHRLGGRRGAAVALVIAAVVLVVGGVVALLGPRAIEEAQQLPDDVPRVLERLGELPLVGDELVERDVPMRIERFFDELPGRLAVDDRPLEAIIRGVVDGALAAFSTMLVLIAVLLDANRIAGAGRRIVPPHQRDRAERFARILYRVIGRYFAGSLLVATMAGTTMTIIGLSFGVPLAPLIGMWITFTNLIPQIGGAAGGIPFVALAFTVSPTTGVLCAVIFLAYQQFENNVLQPVVIGQAVDLSPPITMVAALVGVSAAGVPGALVAVPLLGAAKAFYVEIRRDDATPEPAEGAEPVPTP